MIDGRHNPDFIADVVGDVLSQQFGKTIRLRRDKVFTTGASLVVRCRVLDAHFDVPASFIAKKAREDESWIQLVSATFELRG
jgi:hypothetical protein